MADEGTSINRQNQWLRVKRRQTNGQSTSLPKEKVRSFLSTAPDAERMRDRGKKPLIEDSQLTCEKQWLSGKQLSLTSRGFGVD